MKIVIGTRPAWVGVDHGLRILSKISGAKYVSIEDDNNLFRYITAIRSENPDVVILGGWDNMIKTMMLNLSDDITKVIRWCSPLTQSELSNEMPRFYDIIESINSGKISYLITDLYSDAMILKSFCNNIVWLPEVCDFETIKAPNPVKFNDGLSHVSLLCAANPRKNILTQLMALRNLDNIKTHTNFHAHHYLILAEILKANVVNHSWMKKEHYYNIISGMYFGTQVSLSESFNHTVAEHMYLGIPVITSRMCPALCEASDELMNKHLIVDNAQDGIEMFKKYKDMTDSKSLRDELGESCKKAILKVNETRMHHINEFVNKLKVGN